MYDMVPVTGMVLSEMPVGEYDRRVVLLTAERGKVSAFARGVRRTNNRLMAACRPFTFGEFVLEEGRSAYTVRSASVRRYFEELAADYEAVCYGFYFCEFADYYGREGIDEREMINLLYASFLALGRNDRSRPLIRYAFELRAMAVHGEYSEQPFSACGAAASYAWQYCLTQPLQRLFSFALEEEAFREFSRAVESLKQYYIDRSFHSLEVLESMKL